MGDVFADVEIGVGIGSVGIAEGAVVLAVGVVLEVEVLSATEKATWSLC